MSVCGYGYSINSATQVAVHWIKDLKCSTTFLWRPSKGRSVYGHWAIVGADREWHNIDKDEFLKGLGIYNPSGMNSLAETLKGNGYNVIDEGICVTVVF